MMSTSDIIVDVAYVLETRHFLNMRYFQTQQLTTMFCVQRSVSNTDTFDWVRPISSLFINSLTLFGLQYQFPRVRASISSK